MSYSTGIGDDLTGSAATAIVGKLAPGKTETARKALSPVYAGLEEAVMRVAKALGVSKEVEQIWSSAVEGASIGSAAGSALWAGAAVGTCVGVVVGIVIALIALATDDSGEKEEARKDRQKKAIAQATKRLDFEGFALEQDEFAWRTLIGTGGLGACLPLYGGLTPSLGDTAGWIACHQKLAPAKQRKASVAAVQLALFFRTLAPQLTAAEANLFLSRANLSRWQAYLAAYKKLQGNPKQKSAEVDGAVAKLTSLVAAESQGSTQAATPFNVVSLQQLTAPKLVTSTAALANAVKALKMKTASSPIRLQMTPALLAETSGPSATTWLLLAAVGGGGLYLLLRKKRPA